MNASDDDNGATRTNTTAAAEVLPPLAEVFDDTEHFEKHSPTLSGSHDGAVIGATKILEATTPPSVFGMCAKLPGRASKPAVAIFLQHTPKDI